MNPNVTSPAMVNNVVGALPVMANDMADTGLPAIMKDTADALPTRTAGNAVCTMSPAVKNSILPKEVLVTTGDILGCLFSRKEIVRFRVFDDKKGNTFHGAKLQCELEQYKLGMEDDLKRHNSMERGVFFIVNYGGHDDASITRINAQFVENDQATFEEQWEKIKAFPLKPSMVIKTQKSLHVYWFMDGTAKVERFREIQKRLIKHFDGDPACVNESRVMRLPGFNHNKTDIPVPVTCIYFHPECRYTQEQLADVLPELAGGPTANAVNAATGVTSRTGDPTASGTAKQMNAVMHSCQFLQHCRDDAATLSEPEWFAMITNLARFEGGIDLIHKLSEPYPGYTPVETGKKITYFLKSGAGPMTCKTICSKGFNCPKLATGGCGVKAPAALHYRPLGVDVLRELLQECHVEHDEIKDLQKAQMFVEDYLYNQDETTAEAVIDQEVCGHFKLQKTGAKLLKKVYKTVKKVRRDYPGSGGASGSGMNSGNGNNGGNGSVGNSGGNGSNGIRNMPWYVSTDRGMSFCPGILAKFLSDNQPVFHAVQRYYQYSSGVYNEISEIEAQRIVQKHMLPAQAKMTQIVDAERQWKLQIQRDVCELNSNPYLINVLNGLYNVLDDTLTAHTPDYYSTMQLNVNYDRQADCPRFKQFLEELMDRDMEQITLIQEMLGYFLIPLTQAQKCFVIVGAANAGKSVLLRVINEILLGQKNVSNVSWQDLNNKFKTAELFGKLANIFADLPTKNIDDNGIFKALVGEDFLTVEKKHKDPFSFRSVARLLFSCNSLPKNYGDKSEGFYRRLVIIRCNHSVPKDKRDPKLMEKLHQEADGIFQFALEGLRRVMGNNYAFSETEVNARELQQYREDSDSVLSFVGECCELDISGGIGSTALFNSYKAYCAECGLKPCSQKIFVQHLMAAFPSVKRGIDKLGKRRILIGIKLGQILA